MARGREIKNLLGIKPDLRELRVNYGGYSGRDDEIDMMTRSMLQIMLKFTAVIQVPEGDVVQGKAGPGLVDTQSAALNGPPLRVQVTDTPPRDAYVAAQYDKGWSWIADNDIQSKYTFGIVMLLFSIADAGVRGRRRSSRYPRTSEPWREISHGSLSRADPDQGVRSRSALGKLLQRI